MAERLKIGAVWNVVPIIVAHVTARSAASLVAETAGIQRKK
jgi:hypothetical protein